MKHDRLIISIVAVSLAALVAMLIFSSPVEIGPAGVLLFFTTVYITCFGLFAMALRLFYYLALGERNFCSKNYLYSAIAAFGPIMLLMARAFSVLSIPVVGLIILFLSLAEFLAAKRS